MFGLKGIVCCGGDDGEEELLSIQWSGRPSLCHWTDDKSIGEWTLTEKQPSIDPYWHGGFAPSIRVLTTPPIDHKPQVRVGCDWGIGASLQAQLSVLYDWATALQAYHIRDVVHGNLTPESVDVVHGRGILISPNQGFFPDPKPFPDDDVHGARWAATELFRIDDDKALLTKMSNVYSFACLMLQMLTGAVPYCGTKRPEQVVYLKYLGREPIDAQTPRVADRYVAFMRRCWSPDPEKRPTIETVVDFLREDIKGLTH